jgi:triosephosphate isomerase
MAARTPLIAGNWKMYGRRADLGEITALGQRIARVSAVEALICPPTPYIQNAAWAVRETRIIIGAQDCSAVGADAARTGEVSAAMLADAGARYVIVGHSERRAQHGESDALVRAKAEAAVGAGLVPIVCVGETLAERAAGQVAAVVAAQVRGSTPAAGAGFVVAYEPVWAIGGDRTPTPAEIEEVHILIRETLAERVGPEANGVRILYGGSVSPRTPPESLARRAWTAPLSGAPASRRLISHP